LKNKNDLDLIDIIDNVKSSFVDMLEDLKQDIKEYEQNINKKISKHKQKQLPDEELHKKYMEVSSLQSAQEELFYALIKLIAKAIDAKNKNENNHCVRVPEIALLIAQRASEYNEGGLKDFKLDTEEKLKEFDIAAWIHDIGKISTPEYITNKATKLETVYNRIHEIRARFEIIHRDLTIEALNKKLLGKNPESVNEWLEKEHQKLQEGFELVAKANLGLEELSDKEKKELKKIAKRTWMRHFDNTIGLSDEEKERIALDNPTTPQVEYLLSDKKSHLIFRTKKEFTEYKKLGFKTVTPVVLNNLGELYNLSIDKGTLNFEERFIIHEHIQITIKMLEQLPFPKYLKNVPLYAGAHHERLDGNGYPRELTSKRIPIEARIIAFADIFEALSATYKTYKKPRTLSEVVQMLYFMAKDNHIDSDLFEMFLKTGLYKELAEQFLDPSQIDEVDIEKYL